MVSQRNFATPLHAINDDPGNGWDCPDLSLARNGIDPPPFPLELLGELRPLVCDLASSAGSPADFVALSCITAAASLIGSKRKLRPYAEASWLEPAILWMGLVCPPSMGKSPAIRPFQTVLSALEGESLADFEEVRRDWLSDTERAKAAARVWQEEVAKATKTGKPGPSMPLEAVEPKEPIAKRFMVNDSTPEALARILSGNPQGVAVVSDELASWFASFERYSGDNRGFWLTGYNGDPMTIDRKGSPEPLRLPFLGMSLLGGIQPSKLAASFRGANDGMSARFLWSWPNAPDYSRPSKMADLSQLESAFRALDALPWGTNDRGEPVPMVLGLDPLASEYFEAFDRSIRAELRDADDTLLNAAVGKMPGQAARLALVIEHLKWAGRGGQPPQVVTGETMEAVCAFLSDYARPMAERVYGDAGLSDADQRTVRLARYLQRNKVRSFNASRDILRARATFHFRAMPELKETLDALTEAGWIKADPHRAGKSPGRHSSDYVVNPSVVGG